MKKYLTLLTLGCLLIASNMAFAWDLVEYNGPTPHPFDTTCSIAKNAFEQADQAYGEKKLACDWEILLSRYDDIIRQVQRIKRRIIEDYHQEARNLDIRIRNRIRNSNDPIEQEKLREKLREQKRNLRNQFLDDIREVEDILDHLFEKLDDIEDKLDNLEIKCNEEPTLSDLYNTREAAREGLCQVELKPWSKF